jgi:hypothetical protein
MLSYQIEDQGFSGKNRFQVFFEEITRKQSRKIKIKNKIFSNLIVTLKDLNRCLDKLWNFDNKKLIKIE